MRRNIFLAALLVTLLAWIAIPQAGAQAGPQSHNILSDPNLFADAHIRGLDARVHLTEEQKAKLRPIFFAEGQTLIAILNDRSLQQDQRRQLIMKLHEQSEAKVASILTPSQRQDQDHSPGPPPDKI